MSRRKRLGGVFQSRRTFVRKAYLLKVAAYASQQSGKVEVDPRMWLELEILKHDSGAHCYRR